MTPSLHVLPTPDDHDRRREQFYLGVGIRLRIAREEAGLTQRALSQASGVPQAHLCEMENGNRYRLSLFSVSQIAPHVQRTMDDLCQQAPEMDYSQPRKRWLLHALARMSEAGEIFLVDMAIEVAKLMPREA